MRLFSMALVCLIAATALADPLSPGDAPATPLRSLSFHGRPGWLVIEAFRTEREAGLRAGRLLQEGIATTPVRSDLFRRLHKGRVVLVYGAFPTRKRADALAAQLKRRKIRSSVENSGRLVSRGGRPERLVRVWGRLDADAMRLPTSVNVDGKLARDSVTADRQGWYQAWLLLPEGRGESVDLTVSLQPKNKAQCDSWFDKSATVDIGADQEDVFVSWSPTPDCGGE